jgi:hypothetical protein
LNFVGSSIARRSLDREIVASLAAHSFHPVDTVNLATFILENESDRLRCRNAIGADHVVLHEKTGSQLF